MLKKILVIPGDPITTYLNMGKTYEYFENAFNPGDFFDEVYCLSPTSEENKIGKIGKVQYIEALPEDYMETIEKIKPDIVRVYSGFYPCDCAVANKVKDIPVVASVHDVNPNLINQSLKYADYIVCKSETVKQTVKKYVDVDEKRIFVSGNRVNTSVFSKKPDKDFKKLNEIYGNGKHILHVGRKTEQKNLETLIRALQYLPSEYSVVCIGPGNSDIYNELAHECNVSERCFFVDHVSRDEELPLYYSWCDCMCTPSRWEGFGFVFVEAAACECAIITSNIAPMNEYLTNEVDSILVDEYENPKTLAKCIIRACSGTGEIQEMKRNARKVGLRFDKAVIDKEEVELYKKFIFEGTDNTQLEKLRDERKKLERKIIIFGAGTNGKRMFDYVGKEKVLCFVDNDSSKIGQQIGGVEIISYSDLLNIHEEYNLVVTPMNRAEIMERLVEDKIDYVEAEWYMLLMKQNKKCGEL